MASQAERQDESAVAVTRLLIWLMLVGQIISIRNAELSLSQFPPIPVITGWPVILLGIAWPCLYLGLFLLAFSPPIGRSGRRLERGCVLVVVSGLGVTFLTDQHWLQPWAWQVFLIFVIDAVARDHGERRQWTMRLACSIYFFSAVSKFDVAFVDNLGTLLVTKGLAPALGMNAALWPDGLVRTLAAALPVVEFAAAVLLWTTHWRRFGLWLATAMHVGLLLTLGPWGLDHHAGVLIWNLFFVLHVWALFGTKRTVSHEEVPPGRERLRPEWRTVLLTVLLLLPIGEPLGVYDHWPGWAVYANRSPKVRLEIAFPEPVKGVDWVGPPQPLTELQVVSLRGWSSATWRTPAYPNERFQLAVIAALLDKLPEDTRFRVSVLTYDPWRSGRSEVTTYETRAAVRQRLDEFWLSTRASSWELPDALAQTLVNP